MSGYWVWRGGANVKKLLEKSPHGKVTGIDYSEISVEKSQKINKAEISISVAKSYKVM